MEAYHWSRTRAGQLFRPSVNKPACQCFSYRSELGRRFSQLFAECSGVHTDRVTEELCDGWNKSSFDIINVAKESSALDPARNPDFTGCSLAPGSGVERAGPSTDMEYTIRVEIASICMT